MPFRYLPDIVLADTVLRFPHDPESGQVGLQLVPAALRNKTLVHRQDLSAESFIATIPGEWNPPAVVVDSLAQIKLVGDFYPGAFGQGVSMRQSASVRRFRYEKQTVNEEGGSTVVRTHLRTEEGLALEHVLTYVPGDQAFTVTTRFHNGSSEPVKVEMLSSFSLSGITPFDAEDASEKLRVHRFRSFWSAEGRLETRSIEDLHLERSWSGASLQSERFGQVGSMPVRKWFPFVAVEDVAAGVVWGAQLGWAGSWQMEVFRQHDDVCLSGGLADREFGHWLKTVQPGETLETPSAVIACVQGGLDDVCDRLTALQKRAADQHPAVEADLPIVFNEWCTTWGDPQHDKVLAYARRLQGSHVKYFVIDAGWYKTEGMAWHSSHGDWNPSEQLFPQGLEATAQAIRDAGLIPGLWFEWEVCGESSTAFSLVDHLLARDGVPITSNGRRFWNLNDPWVVDYLTEKVIGLLERGGFGYLKVDYNETIGLGVDHPDSLGEGLRLQTLATYRFFERIRERLPHLVIENCASGGHRLEPSMLARTAMSSFSDAHELVEIPIIAAALHRLILPRQSQIWAVLRAQDSEQRLIYSLAATFLGRMCLSGEIGELSEAQWQIVDDAQALYRLASPIIKDGVSRSFGEVGPSWRHPQGWQAMVREGGDAVLVVFHAFEQGPVQARVPLPSGQWQVQGRMVSGAVTVRKRELVWETDGDFTAAVVVLKRLAGA